MPTQDELRLMYNKSKKWLEWKNDPVKFAEELVYLPTPGGDRLVKLYPPQKEILRSFYKDRNIILLKSRQIGMSTICRIIITHTTIFYDNVRIGIISKSGEAASAFCILSMDIINKIKEKWILPTFKISRKQSYELSNGSALLSQAVSPANPGSVFRGESLTILILDECAFINDIDEVWTSLGPALSKAQQDAKRYNIPYGTIVLSTPNGTMGKGLWYFRRWTQAQEDDSIWKPHRIHWSEIPDFRDDPDWYKLQCKELEDDPRKISQELECKFISSSDCLFSEEVQMKLQEEKPEPARKMRPQEGGMLHIYKKDIDRDKFYLIGCDPCGGAGSDSAAIEVIDFETMEQIIEFKGKVEPKKFIRIIKLVHNICPKNLIIIENTGGYGLTILSELSEDRRYNVYEEIKYKKNTNGVARTSTKKRGIIPQRKEITLGLSNNIKTRPLIIDSLYQVVDSYPELILSRKLSDELLSLVEKNGKIQAAEGFHDDLVMAYAFCCYVRKYCREQIPYDVVKENREELDKTMKHIDEWNSTNFSNPIKSDTLEDMNLEIARQIKSNPDMFNGYVDLLKLYQDRFKSKIPY